MTDKSWMWNWPSADVIPFARDIGVELVEATTECVRGRLAVQQRLCNPLGVLHGGAAMSFADSLCAIGAFMNLPSSATGTTTIESKTNFLNAAKLDEIILGEARPLQRGKRISVWQARLLLGEKPVAHVIQTYMALGV